MLSQVQKEIIEQLKEQPAIIIKAGGLEIRLEDKICIHSISLSVQSLYSRENEKYQRLRRKTAVRKKIQKQ